MNTFLRPHLRNIIIIIIIIIITVVVVDDDTYYWVYLSSDRPFQVYYKVRQNIPYAVCLNRASSLEPRSLVLSWLIQLSFYKGNLQAKLLFSDSRTIATLVNYTCESFINMTVDSSVGVTSRLRKFLGS